jgi:hypothetical protein
MAKRSNPDIFLASTPQERALCRALVPVHFWNPKRANIFFMATKFREKALSVAAQRQWVRRLTERPPRKAPLVVIGSTPTDTGGLHLAYYILTEYMKIKGRDVAVLDAALPVPRLESYPGCAVIHNILEKATPERVQQVRDLTNRFYHTIKLVVVGGTKDPAKWVVQKMGSYPDIALRVKDVKPEDLRND